MLLIGQSPETRPDSNQLISKNSAAYTAVSHWRTQLSGGGVMLVVPPSINEVKPGDPSSGAAAGGGGEDRGFRDQSCDDERTHGLGLVINQSII